MTDTENMTSPVRCARCGTVYDLGHVTVTARHADCSMWKTPCCDTEADDRVGGGAFTRLTPGQPDRNGWTWLTAY